MEKKSKGINMQDILKLSESERLDLANSEIQNLDLRGKAYALVNSRIEVFRKYFPGYGITTEIINETVKEVVQFNGNDKVKPASIRIKAYIVNQEGVCKSTGISEEVQTVKGVNSTSHIENCETSAVGRALGLFGIGVKESLATYEEVMNAIKEKE